MLRQGRKRGRQSGNPQKLCGYRGNSGRHIRCRVQGRRRKFLGRDKKIKKIQKEIKEINETENLNEKLVGVMKDIVIKFDAVELCKQYF